MLRMMKTPIWPRVTARVGQYSSGTAVHPDVMPFDNMSSIAVMNAWLSFAVLTSPNEVSTVKVTVTGAAAPQVTLSPGWLAVIEQVPAATNVTTGPDTVHTPVEFEANATRSPELA